MNDSLKCYLAEIGRRGGLAKTQKKASAVRRNGGLGGRPRKDGLPPGTKSLEDVLSTIDASALPDGLKADLRRWVNSKAFYRADGSGFLGRAEVSRVESSVGAVK